MKFKKNWNLNLLYKGVNDPKIERNLKAAEAAFSKFEKKYKNKDFTQNTESLLQALKDMEKLNEILNNYKPWWYFALLSDLNSNDKVAGAKATQNQQRLNKTWNKTAFFELKIGKISSKKQREYLKSKRLSRYSYQLKKIFDSAKYQLSEGEEKIINLLTQTSYSMWVEGQERVLNDQTVKLRGKDIPIVEALNVMSSLSESSRNSLQSQVNEKLKSISNFAEAEFNALYNYKKIIDEERKYKFPYSSTVLGNENTEEEISQLVSTVTKHFSISKRFYKLHAKLLKKKKINYQDRSVKIGKISRKFSFDEALKLTARAFRRVDEKFEKMVLNYARNGQYDVYPKKGKRGGAYSWGGGKNPVFVLLNHSDNIHSVETLGHEMGHSAHSELSKSQPVHYQGYSMAVAETASTFFEQVTQNELEQNLTDKEKIIFLHNKIQGDVQTIFRQIAFFNFELELHQKIRKEGQVSKGDIADLLNKHTKSYMGDAVNINHDDGYFFVYLSHARRFFYVYSYAYGQLISKALFERWKNDPKYSEKIEKFLSAGSSMSPSDIFKSIGIDTTKPSFFLDGLKSIEKDIIKLEKLTSR